MYDSFLPFFFFLTSFPQGVSTDRAGQGLSNPHEEAVAVEGEYTKFYETQGPIGKGAFGFVKRACRRSDGLSVSEPNSK